MWKRNKHFILRRAWSKSHLVLWSASFLSNLDNRDATVELSFVESEAQAYGLSERGRESVDMGQTVRLSHFRESNGACSIVQSDGNSIASHLVGETGLSAVVPGSQLPVMLLRHAP